METVRRILSLDNVYGMDDMEINDNYEVDPGSDSALMPLTIEKVRDDVLAVDQYFIQRMDRMQDPGARFEIKDYDGSVGPNGWNPIEYRQDPFPQVYERDTDGLGVETVQFINDWDENLSSQGFYELARDGCLSGPEQ